MDKDKDDNVEVVDFKRKDYVEKASEKLVNSARAMNVQFVDDELNVDNSLKEAKDTEVYVGEMNAAEIDMFRQMAGIGIQLKKDLDLYQEQANNNLKKLFSDDPEKLSAYLVKKAISHDIDKQVAIRICRNQDLYNLLRKTMFWRIQERTGIFHLVLNVRKGFTIYSSDHVQVMQVDEAVNRLKKMAALEELEKSNHPMKHVIRQMIESENLF